MGLLLHLVFGMLYREHGFFHHLSNNPLAYCVMIRARLGHTMTRLVLNTIKNQACLYLLLRASFSRAVYVLLLWIEVEPWSCLSTCAFFSQKRQIPALENEKEQLDDTVLSTLIAYLEKFRLFFEILNDLVLNNLLIHG